MTQSSPDTTVEEIIASATGYDESDFDEDTDLGPEGLDLDSIAIIEVVEIIEIEFDVAIPDDDLEELDTVGDIKEHVRQIQRA